MEFIQSILVIFLEISCYVLFQDIFLKSYHERKIIRFVFPALMILSYLITDLLEKYFILKEIAMIICLSIGSLIIKKNHLIKCLFISSLFVFLLLISDLITITIDTQILTVDSSNEMLIVLMSKAVLLMLVMIIRYFFGEKWIYFSDQINEFRFLAFPLVSICIIAVIISDGYGIQEITEDYLKWGMIFCLIAMNVLMFFNIRDIAERNYLSQEKRMFELDARGQQTLYRSLEEKIELQKRISHDYKNHLSYIQCLLEKKEYTAIEEYLKKIIGQVNHDLDMIDTNNPIINTVINTKYNEAKNIGAVIVCKINDLSAVDLDEMDVILLLSNLFNNAIEALEKCEIKRILRFKIICEGTNFIISIQNTFTGSLKKKGDIYETTKQKEPDLHGIGMSNIIRIVNKYNGMYQFDVIDKEFNSIIIIPIENNKASAS